MVSETALLAPRSGLAGATDHVTEKVCAMVGRATSARLPA
jgi:hypothetical protein